METWQKRELTTCSDCLSERGNVLNLVSTFVIDSDVILEVLAGDDSRDENIFLIEGDYLNTKAVLYGIPYLVFHYNRIFINQSVISRYENDINCYVLKTLGGGDSMVSKLKNSIQFQTSSGFVNLYLNPIELTDNGNNAQDTVLRGGTFPLNTGYAYIVPITKKYQFTVIGSLIASCLQVNTPRSFDLHIKIWVVDAIDIPFAGAPYVGTPPAVFFREQIITITGSEQEYFFSLDLTENLTAGQYVFISYLGNGIFTSFGLIQFNQLDFSYVDCVSEYMQTD